MVQRGLVLLVGSAALLFSGFSGVGCGSDSGSGGLFSPTADGADGGAEAGTTVDAGAPPTVKACSVDATLGPISAKNALSTANRSGQAAWKDPTNALVADGDSAEVVLAPDQQSEVLLFTTFVAPELPPSAQILGLTFEVRRSVEGSVKDVAVLIGRQDVVSPPVEVTSIWPVGESVHAYGGPDDLWGLTFTRDQLASGNLTFGILIAGGPDGPAKSTAKLDSVRAIIHYCD